jgi:glycosyltransferase involved in cell wall biosynthesis
MGFDFNEMQQKSNGGTEQTCRLIESRLPTELLEHFQIIPSRVGELKKDKIRVYHLHDLPQDPETNHLKDRSSRDRFHKLVFCGNWQYNQYINMLGVEQTGRCAVIETPIVPLQYKEKSFDKEIRIIYTSTPQRGLALLVPVFEELSKKYENVYLDVFSSFEIYGWKNADEQFKELFERCRKHPKIAYHGSQPNEVVRTALEKAHIFAYPSIWQECNSRSLIEAMSAGLMCLHPNLAGLSDTAGGITFSYQFEEDANVHANKFYHFLENAIQNVNREETQNYLKFVKAYADNRFNIERISYQWEDMLKTLLNQYQTPESRKLKGQMFTYKVG